MIFRTATRESGELLHTLGRRTPKIVQDFIGDCLKQSCRPYSNLSLDSGKTWPELLAFEKERLHECMDRFLAIKDKRSKAARAEKGMLAVRGARAIFIECYMVEWAQVEAMGEGVEAVREEEDPN